MKKLAIFMAILACICTFSLGYYKLIYKPEGVVNVHSEYAFDVMDKALLTAWSDNVFVGTVVSKEREFKSDTGPKSEYKVKVEESIKGDLNGIVKIIQDFGYDDRVKAIIKAEGDEALIENNRYLFVAKRSIKTNTLRIVPVYGDILIKNAEEKDKISKMYEFSESKIEESKEKLRTLYEIKKIK